MKPIVTIKSNSFGVTMKTSVPLTGENVVVIITGKFTDADLTEIEHDQDMRDMLATTMMEDTQVIRTVWPEEKATQYHNDGLGSLLRQIVETKAEDPCDEDGVVLTKSDKRLLSLIQLVIATAYWKTSATIMDDRDGLPSCVRGRHKRAMLHKYRGALENVDMTLWAIKLLWPSIGRGLSVKSFIMPK